FQGSLLYLEQVRDAVNVLLLQKNFILNSYQLVEAKGYGADAVLLIAAMLDRNLLCELCEQATALSLDSLIKVHTEAELNAAVKAEALVLGINNRDLRTFEMSLATTKKLTPLIPTNTPTICENNINNLKQIQQIKKLNIHTFLINESLIRAP